jgi:mono/diheme cytochrome c family protein
MRFLPVLAGLSALGVSTACLAAGNAEAGKELAARSCSACHALPSAASAADAARPFANIARAYKDDRRWIRAWLMNPHPPMKGLDLSRQQIDDIVAYLETLSVHDGP